MSNKKEFSIKDYVETNLEIAQKRMDEECSGLERSAPTDKELEHYISQWEYVHIHVVLMPDGRMLLPSNVEFQVSAGDGIDCVHRIPEDCHIDEMPIKDIFPNFETFLLEYHGLSLKKN